MKDHLAPRPATAVVYIYGERHMVSLEKPKPLKRPKLLKPK